MDSHHIPFSCMAEHATASENIQLTKVTLGVQGYYNMRGKAKSRKSGNFGKICRIEAGGIPQSGSAALGISTASGRDAVQYRGAKKPPVLTDF